jgi:hypothetical protein
LIFFDYIDETIDDNAIAFIKANTDTLQLMKSLFACNYITCEYSINSYTEFINEFNRIKTLIDNKFKYDSKMVDDKLNSILMQNNLIFEILSKNSNKLSSMKRTSNYSYEVMNDSISIINETGVIIQEYVNIFTIINKNVFNYKVTQDILNSLNIVTVDIGSSGVKYVKLGSVTDYGQKSFKYHEHKDIADFVIRYTISHFL